MKQLVVVTGMGAMGLACARRIGSGMRLVLVDNDDARIDAAVAALSDDGYDVLSCKLDLADPAAIAALATTVTAQGQLRVLVHTAAVSQSLAASAHVIYAVNLSGTARLLDAMLALAGPSTVGVVIASMGAQFVTLAPEVERLLALAPVGQLEAVVTEVPDFDSKNKAYLIAKRGNQLRVEAQSLEWAKRGARLVSVSPGVISTAQGRLEMRAHAEVEALVRDSPAGRIGTPDDIAAIVEWLVGPHASYVTGVDIRADGGTIAAQRWRNGPGSA